MALYWDLMFNTETNSTTLADLNKEGTTTVASYVPKYNGRLLKVMILPQNQAATSLMEGIRVELECTIWRPNRIRFGATGTGLRTAPAFPQAAPVYDVDQQVATNQEIKGQYLFVDTATTPRIEVWGLFQA